MEQVRVMVQTPWNHKPDTMESTRQYGHCRHHGIIHQTLCMPPGNMDIIGTADTRKPYRIQDGHLQTQHTTGSHTQDAIYTSSNHGHHALCRNLATIQQIQWIPQVSIDNVDNREPYNRQYPQFPAQWTTWEMDTRRHHTADTLDTTMHRGHHGQRKC